jgi:hypothetical protein
MLSTVIDRLTSLGSKYFVIGAFVPVIVFAFINGVLLYLEFDWFHRWADPQTSGAARAFDVGAVAVGLAVIAFVVWTLNAFLIEVLEGRHLRTDGWLGRELSAAQLGRFRNLRGEYFIARNTATLIERMEPTWREGLTSAAVRGLKVKSPAGMEIDNTVNTYDGTAGDAAKKLANLRELRIGADDIPVADLKAAVDAFMQVLGTNNVLVPHATAGKVLTDDHRDLLTVIEYAKYRFVAREVLLANQLQWRFGIRDVAPTALGNVAAALQSYGLTRYGINLPTFWSRLQAILRTEKEAFEPVQDAKSQFDFLVSSCWLATLTTAVWGAVLPIWGSSLPRFIATMVLGPIVARLCYIAAVENYIVFGETVRSSVDLHRLRLLDALHVRRPTSLRDERYLWHALQQVTAYGQETVDIGYRHPPEAKA